MIPIDVRVDAALAADPKYRAIQAHLDQIRDKVNRLPVEERQLMRRLSAMRQDKETQLKGD